MAARNIIAPRFARFHRPHPNVVLDIVLEDALAARVVGRFDAGIRVGGQLEKTGWRSTRRRICRQVAGRPGTSRNARVAR
ncbi:hypothetical protein MP631_12420 [Xanthomonas phaseoli pv. phaseoli]|nr:hypothetical protein MP631_12420 [Xanthomonas phaseoli pv. phaseoli]